MNSSLLSQLSLQTCLSTRQDTHCRQDRAPLQPAYYSRVGCFQKRCCGKNGCKTTIYQSFRSCKKLFADNENNTYLLLVNLCWFTGYDPQIQAHPYATTTHRNTLYQVGLTVVLLIHSMIKQRRGTSIL